MNRNTRRRARLLRGKWGKARERQFIFVIEVQDKIIFRCGDWDGIEDGIKGVQADFIAYRVIGDKVFARPINKKIFAAAAREAVITFAARKRVVKRIAHDWKRDAIKIRFDSLYLIWQNARIAAADYRARRFRWDRYGSCVFIVIKFRQIIGAAAVRKLPAPLRLCAFGDRENSVDGIEFKTA